MNLKEKSSLNADAAGLLIKGGLYVPSIHCSYYSCFQQSLHKLNECGIDYASQERNANMAVDGKGKPLGTHVYTIKETETKLLDGRLYRQNMFLLKRLRKKSDYVNDMISPVEAQTAYGYMQNILSVLVD